MALLGDDGPSVAAELAAWLRDGAWAMYRAEAEWLSRLAEFDACQGYLPGHPTCVGWLVANCRLSRSSAKEKLRIAKQLRRYRLVADALAEGEISYSAVRVLTRMNLDDPVLEATMVSVAKVRTVTDLEQLARHQQLIEDQDKPPNEDSLVRTLRCYDRSDGTSVLELTGRSEDVARVMEIIDLYADHVFRGGLRVGAPVDAAASTGDAGPVDAAAASGADPAAPLTMGERRADAVFDLMEEAIVGLHERDDVHLDVSRAELAVIVDYDRLVNDTGGGICEIGGGAPLTGEAARRLACDGGLHRLITRGTSEVLDVGTKTRAWTEPMRRAIRARHGYRCAAEGCERRITQIHHLDWVSNNGSTAVHLGIPYCSSHHHLVHEAGWTTTYDPVSGDVRLTSPDARTSLRTSCGFRRGRR